MVMQNLAWQATLDRRASVTALLRDRGDLLVVSGLAAPSFDVHAAGDTDANYYLWGAMGSASLVGLGLAQARSDRRVLVITGDGEQLMGLGGLATIAVAKPNNLTIAIIDNGHFGETGMQTSHTGLGLDLARVAAACGFSDAQVVDDMVGVERVRTLLHGAAEGPRLYVLRVKADSPPRSIPPRDAVYMKHRFQGYLGIRAT
jgi:thiamine pyrophosphate-dependent acetolactate synthase large subunit-like protein